MKVCPVAVSLGSDDKIEEVTEVAVTVDVTLVLVVNVAVVPNVTLTLTEG